MEYTPGSVVELHTDALESVTTAESLKFRLGINLGKVVESETLAAVEKPELFRIPLDAELPGLEFLDPEVVGTARLSWQLHRANTKISTNHLLTAHSQNDFDTWVKWDTTPEDLSRGIWHCHAIYVEGVHLPFTLDALGAKRFKIDKKTPFLDNELNFRIQRALGVTREEVSDEELRTSIDLRRRSEVAQEVFALKEVLTNPDGLLDKLDPQVMALCPDRLMSEEEVNKWLDMVKGLKGETRVNKKSGHAIWKPVPGFAFPVALEKREFMSTGEEANIISLSVPMEVKVAGKVVGYTLVDVIDVQYYGSTTVKFKHGSYDIYRRKINGEK